MRILMWFGIGFAASCALSVYVLPAGWAIAAGMTAFAIAAVAVMIRFHWKKCGVIIVLFLGIGAGFLRYNHYQHSKIEPALNMDQQTVNSELIATDYSYETDYGYAVEANGIIAGVSQNIRVYLDEDYSLSPGDAISGVFRFRFTAPKEGEKTSFLQANGIFLTANQKSELVVVKCTEGAWKYLPARLARAVKDLLKSTFPEDVYPLVKAVLLGDSSDISYEVDTALKTSGIRHIIAVSGLHVSILYGFIAVITGKRRFLTALIGLPVLLVFAGVAGFTPSVTRACVMTGLMMLSQLLQKEYDGPTALSVACLIMLFVDPVSISSVSLQLSAGCVAGIFLFYSGIQNWINKCIHNVDKEEKSRLKSWLSSSVAMTVSAMSLTTPLAAHYFGTVSIVGILTNLLTLWILNGIFIGIIVTCLLGLVWTPAAALLGSVIAWPVRYVLLVSDLLSKAPFAAVYTASGFAVGWLVLCYVLIPVFFWPGRRSPAGYFCAVVLSLVFALGASWAEPLLSNCVVTALDVGQGQSIILQSKGKTFLVDCGGSYGEDAADIAAQKLLSMGIGRLDAVVLTHEDSDHTNGLAYLLTRVDTDMILLPATACKFELPETDAEIIWIDRETELSFGDTVMRIFPPVFSASNNENSLCILFDTEKCDILITGDRSTRGEERLLMQYDIPDVDLLVAGHHGSKNSTGEELLEAARPETVIISAGRGNIYGHPSSEVLDRLNAFGCAVLRTDLEGTIIFRR